MKKRKYPKNPDCPLTKAEKVELGKVLDDLEWKSYASLKHFSSAWSEAKVTEYDEFDIEVEVKTGVDSQGSTYTYDFTIERSNFSLKS